MNRKALAVLFELHPRGRFQPRVGDALAGQREGQRHGEAPGVGGSDQFFRIGPGAVLEAALEAVTLILKHARLRGERAFAVLAGAVIARRCGTE